MFIHFWCWNYTWNMLSCFDYDRPSEFVSMLTLSPYFILFKPAGTSVLLIRQFAFSHLPGVYNRSLINFSQTGNACQRHSWALYSVDTTVWSFIYCTTLFKTSNCQIGLLINQVGKVGELAMIRWVDCFLRIHSSTIILIYAGGFRNVKLEQTFNASTLFHNEHFMSFPKLIWL